MSFLFAEALQIELEFNDNRPHQRVFLSCCFESILDCFILQRTGFYCHSSLSHRSIMYGNTSIAFHFHPIEDGAFSLIFP